VCLVSEARKWYVPRDWRTRRLCSRGRTSTVASFVADSSDLRVRQSTEPFHHTDCVVCEHVKEASTRYRPTSHLHAVFTDSSYSTPLVDSTILPKCNRGGTAKAKVEAEQLRKYSRSASWNYLQALQLRAGPLVIGTGPFRLQAQAIRRLYVLFALQYRWVYWCGCCFVVTCLFLR